MLFILSFSEGVRAKAVFFRNGRRIMMMNKHSKALIRGARSCQRVIVAIMLDSWVPEVVEAYLFTRCCFVVFLCKNITNAAGIAGGKTTNPERISHFERARSEILAAQRILVVGGGALGIELVGEIKEHFPKKDVTLVTSKELMDSPHIKYPVKLRTKLKEKLRGLGIFVHTGVGRVTVDVNAINECGHIVRKKVCVYVRCFKSVSCDE